MREELGDMHSEVVMTVSQPCLVHKTHAPTPKVNCVHHVWPKGKGGPNIAANRVVVCPTGHYNIHSLLAEYEKASGDPGSKVRSHYSELEIELAALGWQRMSQGHM